MIRAALVMLGLAGCATAHCLPAVEDWNHEGVPGKSAFGIPAVAVQTMSFAKDREARALLAHVAVRPLSDRDAAAFVGNRLPRRSTLVAAYREKRPFHASELRAYLVRGFDDGRHASGDELTTSFTVEGRSVFVHCLLMTQSQTASCHERPFVLWLPFAPTALFTSATVAS